MISPDNLGGIAGKELAERAMIRSQFYKLFSLAFKNPEIETLKVFTDQCFLEAMENELRDIGIDADTGEFRKFLGKYNNINELFYDMQVNYTKNFIVNYKKNITPLFESVYKDGCLMGKSAVDVKTQYGKENLELSMKTPPDHIALEFEFMCLLCEREMEAWRNGNFKSAHEYLNKEKYFLKNHLDWIPSFSRELTIPWRFFADLSDSFIEFDIVNLNLTRKICDANFMLRYNLYHNEKLKYKLN